MTESKIEIYKENKQLAEFLCFFSLSSTIRHCLEYSITRCFCLNFRRSNSQRNNATLRLIRSRFLFQIAAKAAPVSIEMSVTMAQFYSSLNLIQSLSTNLLPRYWSLVFAGRIQNEEQPASHDALRKLQDCYFQIRFPNNARLSISTGAGLELSERYAIDKGKGTPQGSRKIATLQVTNCSVNGYI